MHFKRNSHTNQGAHAECSGKGPLIFFSGNKQTLFKNRTRYICILYTTDDKEHIYLMYLVVPEVETFNTYIYSSHPPSPPSPPILRYSS